MLSAVDHTAVLADIRDNLNIGLNNVGVGGLQVIAARRLDANDWVGGALPALPLVSTLFMSGIVVV